MDSLWIKIHFADLVKDAKCSVMITIATSICYYADHSLLVKLLHDVNKSTGPV